MKKFVALFLVMALLAMSSSAVADDFTLRKGIRFGDSIDSVLEKEPGASVDDARTKVT